MYYAIISKNDWATSMWSYPYVFLYKALMFQANFTVFYLEVIYPVNEWAKSNQICQRMERDMTPWCTDVESQRSQIKVMGSYHEADF